MQNTRTDRFARNPENVSSVFLMWSRRVGDKKVQRVSWSAASVANQTRSLLLITSYNV